MATRIIHTLIDDLDGMTTEDVETLSFGIDGGLYEIDLSSGHATDLRKALGLYADCARRTSLPRSHRANKHSTQQPKQPALVSKEQNDEIRRWARDNEVTVSSRGRIPDRVMNAWHAAHPPTKK